jgi:uncharacterized protein YndB with AHSA1/START domain
MMRILCEARIEAAPSSVFRWVAEPEKAMRWQGDVKEQEIITASPGVVGTTFREVVEDGSGRLEMRGLITRYVENEVMAFHLVSRIHELEVSYSLAPAFEPHAPTAGSTRITVEAAIRWKFPMNLVSLVAARRMRAGLAAQLQSELSILKRLCEADGADAAVASLAPAPSSEGGQ